MITKKKARQSDVGKCRIITVHVPNNAYNLILDHSPLYPCSLQIMTDLSYIINRTLSTVTPYRFLTGAGIGFSGFFFAANVGANIFGLIPLISNPTLRTKYSIPIELAVRQWDWFFAKAMVSMIKTKKRGISFI